jgi:bloom syndrome protein
MEQIAKDKDDGTTPLTEEDKTRLIEEVKKVMEYCTNISRCRRVQVLRYFNEAFHESDCHKGCDVCMDDAEVTTRDVTNEAIQAIKLLKSMSGNNSMAHCKAVFVGSKKKDVVQRGHDGLPGHGKGHTLGQKGIDQLFEELVAMDVFREQAITNSGGWSNSYLQVSDRDFGIDGCRLCLLLLYSLDRERTRCWVGRKG